MERLTKVMNCDNGSKLYDFSDEVVSNYKEHSERVKLAIKKLANYEDEEEKGLVMRLPCKVGDVVYVIADNKKIYPLMAQNDISIIHGELHILCESQRYVDLCCCSDLNKKLFLTLKEAEQALKKMESEG